MDNNNLSIKDLDNFLVYLFLFEKMNHKLLQTYNIGQLDNNIFSDYYYIFDELSDAFFRITGYEYNRETEKLNICKKNGLLSLSSISKIYDTAGDLSILLDKHYKNISSLKSYRNKAQHNPHDIHLQSIYGTNDEFDATFMYKDQELKISSLQLCGLVGDLNTILISLLKSIWISIDEITKMKIESERSIKDMFNKNTYEDFCKIFTGDNKRFLAKMMFKKNRMEIKLDNPNSILEYYSDNFEEAISKVIRSISVYYYLRKETVEVSVFLDYYYLSLIYLRRLFESKMQKTDVNYQLSFNQWIGKFLGVFNKLDSSDCLLKNNFDAVEIAVKNLHNSLKKFKKIYDDNEITNCGSITVSPFKVRIFNAASKFVAHNFSKDRIEEWEYSNKIYVSDKEILMIVDILSEIQNNYRNLMYYWFNPNKVKPIRYSKSYKDKAKLIINQYLSNIKNI